MPFPFSWQRGYGAFSYSHAHIDRVVKYILNQEAHHGKQKFKNEFIEFLNKYDIPFDEQHLFDFYDV